MGVGVGATCAVAYRGPRCEQQVLASCVRSSRCCLEQHWVECLARQHEPHSKLRRRTRRGRASSRFNRIGAVGMHAAAHREDAADTSAGETGARVRSVTQSGSSTLPLANTCTDWNNILKLPSHMTHMTKAAGQTQYALIRNTSLRINTRICIFLSGQYVLCAYTKKQKMEVLWGVSPLLGCSQSLSASGLWVSASFALFRAVPESPQPPKPQNVRR